MRIFGLFPSDVDRQLAADEAHYAVRDHGMNAKAHLRESLSNRTWRNRVIRMLALRHVRTELNRL
jgi:hypothetical protein